MRLPILYYGHPTLRKKCTPIGEITEEIRQLAKNMIETMDSSNGIGLAAPQVGHSIRMFVLRDYIFNDDGSWSISPISKVYINPQISNPTEETCVEQEGCVSIPHLRVPVVRPVGVTIEATDLNGNQFIEEIFDYNARVRMHENDHINGVLCVDRTDQKTKNRIEAELRAIKKKYNP